MKTRQEKALEIRDLITQVNARVAELEEEGCIVEFVGESIPYCISKSLKGMIKDVLIERTSKL